MINVSRNVQYGTFADVYWLSLNDRSYFGEETVGGKSETVKGRRNDDKTIKKDPKERVGRERVSSDKKGRCNKENKGAEERGGLGRTSKDQRSLLSRS